MTRILRKVFGTDIRGISLAKNDLSRDLPFTKTLKNCYVDANEELRKRNGFQIGSQAGAILAGLSSYMGADSATGAVEEKVLCWTEDPDDSDIVKLNELNPDAALSITYTGGTTATFQLIVNSSVWTAYLVENGSAVSGWPKTYGTGLESSFTAIESLRSDIDGETGFTATITGVKTQVPVGALGPIDTTSLSGSATSFTFQSFSPIQTGVNTGDAYTNDSTTTTWTNPNMTVLNRVAYWARDQQESVKEAVNANQSIYKYDGLRCYRAGLITVSIASIADGTVAAGFDALAKYQYKLHIKRVDNRGNTVYSRIDDEDHTVGGSDVSNLNVTLGNMSAGNIGDYMCRYAIVSGGQTSASITVDSGNTIQAGELVWILDNGTLTQYAVVSATDTNVTFASSVTLADNAIISTHTFELFRTIDSGSTFYFVVEQPYDPENSWVYSDTTVDNSLVANDELLEPLISRKEPPKARYVTEHQGLLIVAGAPGREQEVFISDVSSPEYVPDSNTIDITASGDGKLTGIASDGERLYIFKNKSYVIVHGNLRVIDPGEPPDIFVEERQMGIGCVSHDTIRKGTGPRGEAALYFLSYSGPQRLLDGVLDTEFGSRLASYFIDLVDSASRVLLYSQAPWTGLVMLDRSTACYDPGRKQYILNVAIGTYTEDTKVFSTSVKIFVYEEPKGGGLGDRWYEWTYSDAGTALGGLGGMSGMCVASDRIHMSGAYQFFSSAIRAVVYREMRRTDKYALADNVDKIDAVWHSPWTHFGFPSVKKLLSSLRFWRTEKSTTIVGTNTVRAYRDLADESDTSKAFTSFTLDFSNIATVEQLQDFTQEDFGSILIEVENKTIYEGFRMSALELAYRAEFEGGELEDL